MVIFSTWTTYGTWLRGDPRGWYLRKIGDRLPSVPLLIQDRSSLKEPPCLLDQVSRNLVTETIIDHCTLRDWKFRCCLSDQPCSCSCRHSGSVEVATENAMKAWCTRRLREAFPVQSTWWTDRGWDDVIEDDRHEEFVRKYIMSQ